MSSSAKCSSSDNMEGEVKIQITKMCVLDSSTVNNSKVRIIFH